MDYRYIVWDLATNYVHSAAYAVRIDLCMAAQHLVVSLLACERYSRFQGGISPP